MKKNILMAVFAVAMVFGVSQAALGQDRGLAALLLNHYSPRNFIEGTIPAADLDTIVQAGIRAPSAGNRQPWHFTVVLNQDLAKKMVSNVVNGNVLIVVSAEGDGRTNNVQILDCALAVQSIYLAAQALGYGSRIYTAPMNNLNANLKGELGLPAGHSAVALVRVGRVQSGVDAVSAASSRKTAAEVVTYRR
jgi:nitroreductase